MPEDNMDKTEMRNLMNEQEEHNNDNIQNSLNSKIHSYSNRKYDKLSESIIIDEKYYEDEIYDSQFVDPSLPDDQDYLFIVQKKFIFENILFNFTSSINNIGAIKIEYDGEIIIRNCTFIGCSSNNEKGSSIYISSNPLKMNTKEETAPKIFENNTYLNCGRANGYVIEITSVFNSLTFEGQVIVFDDIENSCGGIYIGRVGTFSIIDSIFIKTKADGSILYKHDGIGTEDDYFTIESCIFENCVGLTCKFDLPSSSKETINVTNCNFNSCSSNSQSNAIGTSLTTDSIELNIENCTFLNCGTQGFVVFIDASSPPVDSFRNIRFYENVFEFSNKSEAAMGMYVSQENRTFLIQKCRFIQCISQDKNQWASSFHAVKALNVIFEGCSALDGSENALVEFDKLVNNVVVKNCTFSYSDSMLKSGGLCACSENAIISNNTFVDCDKFAVTVNADKLYQFELNDNIFLQCEGYLCSFIIDQLIAEPNINGNIIENCSSIIFEAFGFSIKNDAKDFHLENNIFKKFNGKLTDYNGENLTLSIINCSFIESTQKLNNDDGIFIFNTQNLKLVFKECSFERNSRELSGILLFKTNNEIIIENCSFNNNSASQIVCFNHYDQNSIPISISNCTFSNNIYTSKTGVLYVNSSLIEPLINNCSFTNNVANIIYIYQETNHINNEQIIIINKCHFLSNNYNQCVFNNNYESKLEITNCDFIDDIQAENGSCVLSSSSEFIFENSTIDVRGNGLKFELQTKLVKVLSSKFLNNEGGIVIPSFIKSAKIENSVFNDCYSNKQSAVIVISNEECFIENNIVNFSSSEIYKSISGMHITSHGNIIVTNNQFKRIRATIKGGIFIEDKESNKNEYTVIFNYNTIEEVGDVKNGVFCIKKYYDFNIDSNNIKNCRMNDYSCEIDLSYNKCYNNSYTLENLTITGCESRCLAGGFGLWHQFSENNENIAEGLFTIQDCLFENNTSNFSTHSHTGGYGGAFSIGNSTNSRTELIINNCSFIGNNAEISGGALSITSSLPVTIHNCSFLNNTSKYGGGAIYISPINYTYNNFNYGILPKITISKCDFIYNKEISEFIINTGHAIRLYNERHADTEIIITNDCKFIDNCNIDYTENTGDVIYVMDIREFLYENSTMMFTDKNIATCGINTFIVWFFTARSSYFSNNGNSFADSAYYQGYGDIYILHSNNTIITNCTFFNSSSDIGAVAYYDHITTPEKGLFILENCYFNECSGCYFYESNSKTNVTILIRNCTFENSSYFKQNQYTTIYIYLHCYSVVIEQCIFHNCGHDKKEYIIDASMIYFEDEINEFNVTDNLFIFDDFDNSCGSIYMHIYGFKAFIHNCTFYNSSRDEDSYWNAHCIYVSSSKHIEISECSFLGGPIIESPDAFGYYYKEDKSGFVITMSDYQSIDFLIQNCTFDSTAGAIFSKAIRNTIRWNEFKNTTKRTIYIEFSDLEAETEIIENHFYELHRGALIYFQQYYENNYILIIRENIFEKITTPLIYNAIHYDHLFAFIFKIYSDIPLTFENNTFVDFQTRAGGFGALINEISEQIKLNIINCTFIYTSQSSEGGTAFRGNDNYNNGNCLVTFDSCYFNGNNGWSYGGCLYLLSELDVIINNCTFVNNSVSNNSYDTGWGGVIYVKNVNELTITDCIFEDNHSPECQVIYCEDTNLPLSITNCKFIDNVNNQTFNYYLMNPQYSFILLTNKINIRDCEFICTRDIFSYPFLFKSIPKVSDITFINITCNYTVLFYVPSSISCEYDLWNNIQTNFTYMFDNFSFINCTGKNYIFETAYSETEITNSLFQFCDDEDRKSGGITIDRFEILFVVDNTFINANTINGTIFVDDQYYLYENYNITIESCTFDKCICKCFYTSSLYYNYANYFIKKCIFKQCTDSEAKCLICADLNSNCIQFVIDECYFINCLKHRAGYLIRIDTSESFYDHPIAISNTVFQFDDSSKACSAIYINNKAKKVYITNCSFLNCLLSVHEHSLANSICAINLTKLIISQCLFDHCGNENGEINSQENAIGIRGNTECIINNCTFNSSSSAISSYSTDISIIGNIFENICANIIRVNHEKGKFNLIDNHFIECTEGCIINARGNYEPTIKGNIFENVLLNHLENNDEHIYAFLIINDENSLLNFDNNSFINITTYYGGFGGLISLLQGNLQINFMDCYFLNNSQSTNGGALQTTNKFNDGNCNLTFTDCFFEDNKASGNGGALYISTKFDVFISNCSFISNIASSGNGGAIYINNEENSINKVQTINNCKFISNSGIDSYAICIKGNDFHAKIEITGNDFVDNFNKETIDTSCIISIETCIITRAKILFENSFSNQENGNTLNVNEYSCFDPPEASDVESIEQTQVGDQTEDDSDESGSSYDTQTEIISYSPDDLLLSSDDYFSSSEIKESESESGEDYSSMIDELESESAYSYEKSESSDFIIESDSQPSSEQYDDSSKETESESSDLSSEMKTESELFSQNNDDISSNTEKSEDESTYLAESNQEESESFSQDDDISSNTENSGDESTYSAESNQEESESFSQNNDDISSSTEKSEDESTYSAESNQEESESFSQNDDISSSTEKSEIEISNPLTESDSSIECENHSPNDIFDEKDSAYSTEKSQEESHEAGSEMIDASNTFALPSEESGLLDSSTHGVNGSSTVIDKNGWKISKAALIGIVCGVAAAVLIAVAAVFLVKMRKKKTDKLSSSGSQSSISEDTGGKSKNSSKTASVKDEDEIDLNFWL